MFLARHCLQAGHSSNKEKIIEQAKMQILQTTKNKSQVRKIQMKLLAFNSLQIFYFF